MEANVQQVVAADGHRFEVRRFAPAASAIDRPGLLFAPALGVPARKYDGLAAALAGAGIDVAVPDWRGLDSSSWRAARDCDWGYRELLRDLEAALATLGGAPRVFGGHSLGGQLAAMLAARHPGACAGLALVASGVPAPAAFRGWRGGVLALLGRAMPLLVWPLGHFPGTHLRFAGREAAAVMRDWAATVRRGGYADYGDGVAMDTLLGRLALPAHGIVFADDWMAPPASLQRLLDKLGRGEHRIEVLDAAALGADADHFRWLRTPAEVARRLLAAWPVSP